MYSFLLSKEINKETVVPCYFFHGEESFLAHQFVQELRDTLISPDVQDYNVERFDVEEQSWMEIIDLARTIPFFLSAWRIIVVEARKGKKEFLSAAETKILEDYFSNPSSQTVLAIIFSGKIRKDSSLLKFFASLPDSLVCVKPLKPLRGKPLFDWMDKKLSALGKTGTFEAKKRMEEMIGNDLRNINNEIEKLVTFIGEKKMIEVDDVNQVSGWVKTFHEWEMADSLEKADFGQSLVVLNNLFKESTKPELIIGIMARFFRDILLAKFWLRDRMKDRRAIFKELKPQIQEKYGKLYRDKYNAFYTLVDSLSAKELNRFLDNLGKIDLKVKTSDVSAQALIEGFLFDYCGLRKKGGIIWKERD